MAQKTWKIGEYCKGGIITAKTTQNKITIIGKDWDVSAGYSRGSNQSNAKEWTRLEIKTTNNNAHHELFMFLTDLTTSGYADKILEWIETKVTIPRYTGWGW